MRALFAASVVIAAALIGSGAQGQDTKAIAPNVVQQDPVVQAFIAADRNKDGKLDKAEFQTLPCVIRQWAVDVNGDDVYDLSELAPAVHDEPGGAGRLPATAAASLAALPAGYSWNDLNAWAHGALPTGQVAGKAIFLLRVYEDGGRMGEAVGPLGDGPGQIRWAPLLWESEPEFRMQLDAKSWAALKREITDARRAWDRRVASHPLTSLCNIFGVPQAEILQDGHEVRPVGEWAGRCERFEPRLDQIVRRFVVTHVPGCERLRHDGNWQADACMLLSGDRARAAQWYDDLLTRSQPGKSSYDIMAHQLADGAQIDWRGRLGLDSDQIDSAIGAAAPTGATVFGGYPSLEFDAIEGRADGTVEVRGKIAKYVLELAPEIRAGSQSRLWTAPSKQVWAVVNGQWRITSWDIGAFERKTMTPLEAEFGRRGADLNGSRC